MQIGNITIIDYSPKSIAVQGETKQYKDLFKSLNGKFNPYLKGGPGWIFSKKRKDIIIRRIKAYNDNEKNI